MSYLMKWQTKHCKVYDDTGGGNRPGWTARAKTFAWRAIPLPPVMIDGRALKGVYANKGCSYEEREDNQEPGYPTKDYAGEDAQVEKQN